MKHKILLSKDGGFRFAKNGDILCGVAKVGEWKKQDVWKQYGRRVEPDGTRFVHYLWYATLVGMTKPFIAYKREELRDILDGRIVEVELDF